jgi:hypothetical protein
MFAKIEEEKYVIEWRAGGGKDYNGMKRVEERLRNRIKESMDWGQVFRKNMLARVGGSLRCSFTRGVLEVRLEIP